MIPRQREHLIQRIRYASNYSDDELRNWADRIRKLKPKRLWTYFNNDFNANAPRNALKLMKFLKESIR